MDAPNIPGLPPGKKGLMIAGGVGAAALLGIYLYKRRGASQSSDDGGGAIAMPQGAALMYTPSGGGTVFGGSGVYANSDPLAGAPVAPAPAPAGASMWDLILAETKGKQVQSNAALLGSLGLKPGDTANLTHSDTGTSLSITSTPVRPDGSKITSSEIRAFIADQEAKGVPINAATIGQWMDQYGVTLKQTGAAFGLDLAGAQAWMAAHPGQSGLAPVSNVGQGGQSQTGGTQTQQGGSQSQTSTGNAMYTGSGIAPYSDSEITGFLDSEAKRLGRALTSADIRGYSAQFAVPVNQIGRAFGLDAAGTDQWLRTH